MVIKTETFLSVLITIVVIGLQTNGFKSPIDCGKSSLIKGIKNFIVGGQDAKVSEFPFMVSLQYKPKKMHFCGASVLSKRWVLTAAHCIEGPYKMGVFEGPENISMVIGQLDNTNTSESYEVEKWVINDCYDNISLSNDITLLKSKTDIRIDNINISSICLPPQGAEPIGTDIIVAGWGVWTETNLLFFETEGSPEILQTTNTSIRSEEYCQTFTYYRNVGLYSFALNDWICLQKDGSTICRGDSGGPAFQIVGGRVYQLGIASSISVAVPFSNRCFKSNAGLYLKVPKFVDWISSAIDRYGDSNGTMFYHNCIEN